MAAKPLFRYLRSMAGERQSLLCDLVPQELHDIINQLGALEHLTPLPPAVGDVSLRRLQEDAQDFLRFFENTWRTTGGDEPDHDSQPQKFLTFTANLAEFADQVKTVLGTPPIVDFQRHLDRITLLAVALKEVREAFIAGREEVLAERKSSRHRARADRPPRAR
jgi:hypothetical protein